MTELERLTEALERLATPRGFVYRKVSGLEQNCRVVFAKCILEGGTLLEAEEACFTYAAKEFDQFLKSDTTVTAEYHYKNYRPLGAEGGASFSSISNSKTDWGAT